jgi:hypothetical protein
LLVFFSMVAQASDPWICTEMSSRRWAQTIEACGIGISAQENEARLKAFDSALAEFKKVCENSSDCKGRSYTLTPERTSCDESNGKYKCYRMIVFTIGDADQNQSPGPGSAPENEDHLFRGMTEKDLLTRFGSPKSTTQKGEPDMTTFNYEGELCNENKQCTVDLFSNIVWEFHNIKPKYSTRAGSS